MTADKPSNLAPKLRFPEFLSGSTWDALAIGDVCDLKAGDFIPASEIAEHADEGSFPCYGGNGFRGYVKSFTHEGRYVLVGRQGALCGNVNLYAGKFHATEHALVATPKPGIDTGWLFYALDVLTLNRFSIGQAQPGLSIGVLRDVGISVPIGEDEQQKIADCLGSLDDLIAVEGRKLEALRQHKQGLVQQFFPRPGESVSRLRFPEFEDAPEWESRELGLMTSKIGSGVTPRGGEKNYRSSGRPFVRSQNVGWGELILDNVVHIDEDTHASFAATEVEEGDVLLNISGASIGRTAVADARIVGGNVNQHVCVIRGLSEQIHPWFLSQYLISKHGQDKIDSCQAGGNRQGLNFGQIRSFLIPQPRDVAEQERIADCLCAADIIRATYAQRISALKRQKQGLLQQLFPSLEG